ALAAGPFFTLAFAALLAWCLAATATYAVPVALSILAWFLINALAEALTRLPGLGPALPRPLARAMAVALLFGALSVSGHLVATSLAELADDVTLYGNPMFLDLWYWASGMGLQEELTSEALMSRFLGVGGLEALLEYVQSSVSIVSLVLVFTMFLLVDEQFFPAKLNALARSPEQAEELKETLTEIAVETRVYLYLMTVISIGVGAITGLACWWLDVPGAALWGFLAFGLNYIPTIGSLAGVALPVAFAALTKGDASGVLTLAAALGATQFLAGQWAVPALMSNRLNLSSFVIMLSLAAWGAIWGPAGLFLAVPITVIATMVFAKFPVTRPIAILLSRTGDLPAAPYRGLRRDG
ncbi:MAG: AI-2E family transporter, partial [Pseudomonadota bacterium]|nr:AI-2E family transporter [Pseudomonadota bacterium]